jgi:hypothetical protein
LRSAFQPDIARSTGGEILEIAFSFGFKKSQGVKFLILSSSRDRLPSRMTVFDHLSAFFQEAANILAEYHTHCAFQLATTTTGLEDALSPDLEVRRGEPLPCFTAEDISQHPKEWFDERIISFAGRTRKPTGQLFLRKMRQVFPSIPRREILQRIEALVSAGRLPVSTDGIAGPLPEEEGEQPEKGVQQHETFWG